MARKSARQRATEKNVPDIGDCLCTSGGVKELGAFEEMKEGQANRSTMNKSHRR